MRSLIFGSLEHELQHSVTVQHSATVQHRAAIMASSAQQLSSHALCLSGTQIDRKLVKQTVMTSVYGITRIGAREQFSNRLRERGWQNEQEVFRCSWYLTALTLDALGELFKNAKVGWGLWWLGRSRFGGFWRLVCSLDVPCVQPGLHAYRLPAPHAALPATCCIATSSACRL
jgi:hypothetical protein